MKKKPLILLFFISFLANAVVAQYTTAWSTGEIYEGIKKLNVLGSVLYIAAHPDDENTRLITYFSKERKLRTGYLSLTRGDGGQNLIGDEAGIDLGLIRTQELLAARRIDGGEQFFSRAYDFGYSKSPVETFNKWGHDRILSDVVWIIRTFRPDVIITRFPTTGEGGHGHHTASAILANEAFTAAADSTKFSEQFNYGVKPWQAKRIMWNGFNFNNSSPDNANSFTKLDIGGFNPLLGKSYGELGAEARSQHKSQGFGVAPGRGEYMEYFKLTGGQAFETDVFDGVDLSWRKIVGSATVQKNIEGLVHSFNFKNPQASVKALVELYRNIKKMPSSTWQQKKLGEVQNLIAQCSGLFLDATTNTHYAVNGDSIPVNFVMINRSPFKIVVDSIKDISKLNAIIKDSFILDFNKPKTYLQKKRVTIVSTQPYWLNNDKSDGYYIVNEITDIGKAQNDMELGFQFSCKIEGEPFVFTRPLRYKFTDPVKGELYQPVIVTNPVLVEPDEAIKLSIGGKKVEGFFKITSMKGDIAFGPKKLIMDSGVDSFDVAAPKNLYIKDKGTMMNFPYKAYVHNEAKLGYIATTQDEVENGLKESWNATYLREIRHDHIPYVHRFIENKVKVVPVDLITKPKNIGYIVGAGDKVPQALQQMGYTVTLLDHEQLNKNNLTQYDAIIAGVRAYNTNDWLNDHYDALMKYVQEGGNLIVQYNTSSSIGPVRAKIGPYKFDIGRNRITDENASVKFINPSHAVLNYPNKITDADFIGWIQERSIYHATNWDKEHYTTVLSMHDPGENDDEGSLIIAPYGKGYFTYTGFVFFRELPEGVPGAYRLMANIIALNENRK